MKKAVPFVLITILAVAVILIKRCKNSDNTGTKTKTKVENKDPASTDRNKGFDRRISFIEYTAHAKCRMPCRQISPAEVEQVMQEGTINYKKSDARGKPCPTYAVEGRTNDGQRVRIVFAQCDLKTKVVTAVDLETEWECHCPGDDAKYKNRN